MGETRKKHRRKKSKKKRMIAWGLRIGTFAALLLIVTLIAVGIGNLVSHVQNRSRRPQGWPSYVKEKYLTVNSNSRPALSMQTLKHIVIHTTSDEDATIDSRRDYYESLKDSDGVQESVHIIADLQGNMVLCIPIDEITYASEDKNTDSISIEILVNEDMPFPEEQGYENLTDLVAWLCYEQNIPVSGVIRHYDINGRYCPAYMVDHEEEWDTFLSQVRLKRTEYQHRDTNDE